MLVLGCACAADPASGDGSGTETSAGSTAAVSSGAHASSSDGSETGAAGSEPGSSGTTGEAGTTVADTSAGGSDSTGDDGMVDGIVAVGYGGIRVISRDGGVTWSDATQFIPDGVDDEYLLRGIAWGAGTWVTTGWKLLTSSDGVAWTEHAPPDGCTVIESVAFGAGTFVATCGESTVISSDGVTWSPGGHVGATGGHTWIFWFDGQFAASGDSGASFVSADGVTWSAIDISRVRACDGALRTEQECHAASWFDGVWLRPQWQGVIERSTDGDAWAPVYADEMLNTVYDGYAFAAGRVAP